MTKISNTIAYPYESEINLFDYFIGTNGDTKRTRNFLISDFIQVIINALTGGEKNWITVVIGEDSNEIISEFLVGASSVDFIISSNTIMSTAGSGIMFDSENGIISGIQVFSGEKYIIAYTRSGTPPPPPPPPEGKIFSSVFTPQFV